jgi:predicted aminopeptidase
VQIAELLFHELAHRRVYAPGDSAFNEAYATIVAETGVKRWLTRPGRAVDAVEWQRLQAQGRRFDALLQAVRERLEELYASDLPDPERRRLKAQSFRRLQDEYRSARAAGRLTGYDTWFSRELNNAHLASVATYRQWVPAFERLLEELGGDLAAFHVEVERLAALSQPERQAQLAAFH